MKQYSNLKTINLVALRCAQMAQLFFQLKKWRIKGTIVQYIFDVLLITNNNIIDRIYEVVFAYFPVY